MKDGVEKRAMLIRLDIYYLNSILRINSILLLAILFASSHALCKKHGIKINYIHLSIKKSIHKNIYKLKKQHYF